MADTVGLDGSKLAERGSSRGRLAEAWTQPSSPRVSYRHRRRAHTIRICFAGWRKPS
jgi:hypothetical protein